LKKKNYYEIWIFLGYLSQNRCINQAQICFLFLYIEFVGFCLCTMTIFCIYVVNLYKPFFFSFTYSSTQCRKVHPSLYFLSFCCWKTIWLLQVNWVEMTFHCIIEVFGNYLTPTIAHVLLPLIKSHKFLLF